jgi:hypothetical protein
VPFREADAEQSRLFIEAARKLGADEEQSAADDVMRRLAEKKPAPRKHPEHK